MASSSSDSNTTISKITINSPNVTDLVFETPIPTSVFKLVDGFTFGFGPGDPGDLPEVFNKVMCTSEGHFKSFVKMFDNLGTDGYEDLAMEIGNQVVEEGVIPNVLVMTGIIDEYAEAGKTAEAFYVYRMMAESEHCAPNAYTYTVIIKALAADSDHNFHGIAKDLVMEMMGKGMQPNASTYTAVFEAFVRQEKMEEAKQFLVEMKANGFVADKKAMRAIRRVPEAKGPVVKSIIDILFDNVEDYSDESEDDDDLKANINKFDWSQYPPESYIPIAKKQVIEDDPENPKDLEYYFNMMCKNGPYIHTLTKMLTMLKNDGFLSQILEIMIVIDDGKIPDVVTHTGVMGFYARADEVKEVLKVFMRMLSLGVAPNAYTYSVLIKALAKDPNFIGDVKKYTLEMMDKGMQPNVRTYAAVFQAFSRLKDFKVEKGREFLKEMKARRFVPNKKAVMEVLKGRKGPVVKMVINILFGK
ncbi:pentatricopeptide repeat-containing protein At5g65560-like [Argentina anserina]|uniref:pentatricopeptide repeat-containing protein At5g65560-like n=1 Tax=Argentina anserina TaxID=57926 RepID=UPI0021764C37|nr:pentatricopeptide repeat-containing protein At5g65560-like [Potentilla anserina]XP_050381006.1 pentatricopeptide repeat-containing protein At5g65560-like [Potentilla anserina]XP_050381007.1 pentatricopeptide repeat-containing protein At5g65560-like [Potentilla anserina]XP_050381008.1 pentatricopeptide repeat-containing protein At5g65560-like [Potentilla anserina]XP_050381009.1 pentatricopeptide repeat-containing protein At5g65560-like [Potentilla anserina]XP_050381010.1 pentatricopeptide re